MARVLIADRESGVLNNMLRDRYETTVVKNMASVADALRSQDFELVAVELQFDDSRMFDVLHLLKSIPRNAKTPVICFISECTELSKVFQDSMQFSTRALGAWMLVELHDHDQSSQQKERVLRIVERCLAGERRKVTLAARESVHERRKEIHELRSAIHKADWSQQTEEQLDTLRNKLMTLLVELCELQLDTLSEQEIIDDSRQHKDSVADSVLAGEDTATRSERKQTLREIKHAVEEFDASTTEETRRKSQGNGKSTANGKDKAERS